METTYSPFLSALVSLVAILKGVLAGVLVYEHVREHRVGAATVLPESMAKKASRISRKMIFRLNTKNQDNRNEKQWPMADRRRPYCIQ